jgi:MFS family permease
VVGPWLGILILERSGSNFTWLFTSSIALTAMALATVWPLHQSVPSAIRTTGGRWISPRAWLPAATVFFSAVTYGGVVSFLPVAVGEKQVSVFFSVYAASLGLSRPASGYLADKFGRAVVILPCLLLLSVSIAMLARTASTAGLVLSAIVYGIGFGGSGPALNAFLIDRVPPEERGAGMGMYAAAFECGLALGSVGLGFILEHSDFSRMLLAASVAPIVGCTLFALRWRK